MPDDQPPEQKNGLLDLLKNLWLPIAEFIAAIITVGYTFYQLWVGDQAAIIYALSGIGFLVLIIVLAWVGFKTKTVTRKIFLINNSTITEKIPAYAPVYQRAARIFLVIVFLAGLLGVGVLYQRRQALQQKLVVLIATFEGPEEVYGLRNEIIEKLNADFSNDAEVEIVKIGEIITPDQGSPYARALGERYLADVVLWGWYRPTQNPNITIHVENLSPDQTLPLKTSETLQPAVTLAELESFSFQQQSGQETSVLISFLIGFIQYDSGSYNQALLRFDDALRKIPSDAKLFNNQTEIYFYRGSTLSFLNQYGQAVADYSKAIQLNPQSTTVYSIYTNRGIAYYVLKQYNHAIADCSQAIQIAPQSTLAYTCRGLTYYDLKQYEHAIADYSQAIQIDPQDSTAYINRGVVYEDQKQYEEAIMDFSQAIQIDPQDSTAYFNRGNTYDDLKQYEQAITDFSKTIQIDPQDFQAYNNRGNAKSGLAQYEEAIADFSQAIQITPQNAIAYSNRGRVYQDQKEYEQAMADYFKAIQIDPQLAEAYYNRGNAYAEQKQYEEAITDFSKAIYIDPQLAAAYHNRGNAYYFQMQYDQAIADFSEAILIDPQLTISYKNRGLAYQQLGKTAESEADFAKYQELGGQGQP